MFSGIIRHIGTVTKIVKTPDHMVLSLRVPFPVNKGDSVAVDGVCLTCVRHKGKMLAFMAIKETMNRTIISRYRKGTAVNLERPLRMNSLLDGHLVLGHTDGVGRIAHVKKSARGAEIAIKIPSSLMKYCAEKGSVAVNGVSLTIATAKKNMIEVALIPYTYVHTNLSKLSAGDCVNLEVDVIARYLHHIKVSGTGV